MSSSPPLAPRAHPTRIGRYTVERPLSKGGMAYVYEGRRESLEGVNPRVAIKVILPEHQTSETFRDLFVNEAKLGASMDHQNLVQIQDFGREGHTWYLVMEYVEGLTLRKILAQCERHGIMIPVHVIAELGRQACNGLHYAHTAVDASRRPLHLIHRDIKPSNLILNPHGIVKVLDFGISKGILREEKAGSVKGTWGYMAPEQAQGLEVGPPADVFGLATVLYELAARRPMFTDQPKEEIKRLLFDDHAARMVAMLDSKLYGRLIGVLVRALQRDPAARYPTAHAFGEALSKLLTDPVTDRDRLMAFYQRMEEPDLEVLQTQVAYAAEEPEVVLVPEGDWPSARATKPARRRPRTRAPRAAGWLSFVAGAAVSVLITLTLIGGGLWAMVVIAEGRFATVPEAGRTVVPLPLAQDEPPGPAGVGAPGEQRPPPIDVRAVKGATAARQPVSPRPSAPQPVPAPSAEPEGLPEGHGVVLLGAEELAEIYLDGAYLGVSPVRRELPEGSYQARFIHEDGREKSFTFRVGSGKEVERVWDFGNTEWRIERERDLGSE